MSESEHAKQREHQTHMAALQAAKQKDGNAPETLKYISEPEDIDSPVSAIEWINSRSAATANLTEEDVDSKEWVIEYAALLSQMEFPPEYGLTGAERAWAFNDAEEFKKPLSIEDRIKIEGFGEVGKEAASKARDGWGTETATSETVESIQHNTGEESSGGGILGRLRRG